MVTENTSSAGLGDQAAAAGAPAPEPIVSPEQELPPSLDQLIAAARAKWDEDHQQELARSKGKDRKIQELAEQVEYSRRAYQQTQAELAQIRDAIERQKLDELPDEMRPLAQETIELRKREQAAREEIGRMQAGWEPIARTVVIQQISQRYGIPGEVLANLNSPQEMQVAGETYLREQYETSKKELFALKAQRGVKPQSFARGGGAGAPGLDKTKFAGTGKVEDFLQAKRDAGEL